VTSREANQAVNAYIHSVRRAVAAFVDQQQIIRLGPDSNGAYALTPPQGDPIVLRDSAGQARIALSLTLNYHAVTTPDQRHGWIHTVKYQYQLETVDDPPREFLRFEWHPDVPDMTYPHAHIGLAAFGGTSIISERAHIPTGWITLLHVLVYAMRDHGIAPVRDDWEERLSEAHAVLLQSLL